MLLLYWPGRIYYIFSQMVATAGHSISKIIKEPRISRLGISRLGISMLGESLLQLHLSAHSQATSKMVWSLMNSKTEHAPYLT
jgi:hypothetical protein